MLKRYAVTALEKSRQGLDICMEVFDKENQGVRAGKKENGKYIKDSGKSSKIPDIMSERKLVSGYRRLMNLRKYRMIVRNIIRGCTYNVIIRLFLRGIIRSRSESSWMNAI